MNAASADHLLGTPPQRGYWHLLHRGQRSAGPPNSMAAVRGVAASGADGFECDVRRTRDGTWVLHHEKTLASGRSRRYVRDLPVEKVGRALCELSEVLRWLGNHPGLLVNVEVKEPGHEEELVAMLEPARRQVMVTSFVPEAVDAVARADSGVRTGYLTSFGGRVNVEIAKVVRARAIVWPAAAFDAARAAWTREHDMLPFVWGVKRPWQAAAVVAAGASGVIADGVPSPTAPS